MKLDLGAGLRPREGFTGVDRVKLGEGIEFDLVSGDRWPWRSESVDELASSHFIEHIPMVEVSTWLPDGNGNVRKGSKDALFFFFDEAFRVIKPGGLFHLTWPALKSEDAFRDPTHRRFIPIGMLHYLSRDKRSYMGLDHYGATCNWLPVAGVNYHYGSEAVHSEEKPEDLLLGSALYERCWDVVKAISVTLKAEK